LRVAHENIHPQNSTEIQAQVKKLTTSAIFPPAEFSSKLQKGETDAVVYLSMDVPKSLKVNAWILLPFRLTRPVHQGQPLMLRQPAPYIRAHFFLPRPGAGLRSKFKFRRKLTNQLRYRNHVSESLHFLIIWRLTFGPCSTLPINRFWQMLRPDPLFLWLSPNLPSRAFKHRFHKYLSTLKQRPAAPQRCPPMGKPNLSDCTFETNS